jgi:hypothetical protein
MLSKDDMYWMACNIYVIAPTGQYNYDKLINLRENRWAYRLERAPVIWKHGPCTLEVIFGADMYANMYRGNTEYTSLSLKREQDTIWAAMTHATYEITPTFWVGGSYNYHTVGETKKGAYHEKEIQANV